METTRGPRHASKRLISWASIIEPNTLEQARTASQMPFIFPHLALMPDAHLGKGATVGSVIPTLGAIIPAAVGVDIGCGTIAVRTQFTAEDFRRMPFADEAGVSDAVAEQVAAKLSDPDEVALSRQFPYRFVSAFEAAPSLRWGYALDKAIELATAKVPAFAGRTLVLVDTSASMSQQAFSRRSTMTPLHAAAVFGVVMPSAATRLTCTASPTGYSSTRSSSRPRCWPVERFTRRVGEVGHGTRIAEALRATYRRHDRVVIVSDMQTFADTRQLRGLGAHYTSVATDSVPANVPVYGFNLGGYRATVLRAGHGNRHEFGGLNDATFTMLNLLEARTSTGWPF
jgi:hypothetical protein